MIATTVPYGAFKAPTTSYRNPSATETIPIHTIVDLGFAYGRATVNIPPGSTGEVALGEIITVPKATDTAATKGNFVGYDATNDRANLAPLSGDNLLGVVEEDALAPAISVRVRMFPARPTPQWRTIRRGVTAAEAAANTVSILNADLGLTRTPAAHISIVQANGQLNSTGFSETRTDSGWGVAAADVAVDDEIEFIYFPIDANG